MNGHGSFRLGYVGVGFGGTCDCMYGMVSCMLLCWGVVFAGLVILASSPYLYVLLFSFMNFMFPSLRLNMPFIPVVTCLN